jgi:hypothetical protein
VIITLCRKEGRIQTRPQASSKALSLSKAAVYASAKVNSHSERRRLLGTDLSVGRTVRQDMARDQINVIRSAGHRIQMKQHLEVPERTGRCEAAFAQFGR